MLRKIGRWLVATVAIVVFALSLTRAAVITLVMPYAFWRLFRDSGYPWWIQIPAATTLALLFYQLFKRYKRGRFDGLF